MMRLLRKLFCLLFKHRWRFKEVKPHSGFAHNQEDDCTVCGKASLWVFHRSGKYKRYVEFK